jgi:hypothetical protein
MFATAAFVSGAAWCLDYNLGFSIYAYFSSRAATSVWGSAFGHVRSPPASIGGSDAGLTASDQGRDCFGLFGKTAIGSNSRLDGNEVARKPLGLLSTPSTPSSLPKARGHLPGNPRGLAWQGPVSPSPSSPIEGYSRLAGNSSPADANRSQESAIRYRLRETPGRRKEARARPGG